MENDLIDLKGKKIEVEISGCSFHRGILIDSGVDIIVLYNSKNNYFYYIPFVHIQRLKEIGIQEDALYDPPLKKPIETEALSFRKIVTIAKGLFVQVYVTENKSFHGFLTSIMNDYFVFHSLAHRTMFISMNHVKWLIPYPPNTTPYSINHQNLPQTPVTSPFAKSFEKQLKTLENQIVILDGGDNPEKIGLLKRVQSQNLTLITAEGETVYRNVEHIKTVQLP